MSVSNRSNRLLQVLLQKLVPMVPVHSLYLSGLEWRVQIHVHGLSSSAPCAT